MATTVIIELGNRNNPEDTIKQANRVKFTNDTDCEITFFTPQGMNPSPPRGTVMAVGATETHNGFTISADVNAVLTYGWDSCHQDPSCDDKKPKMMLRPRTGTIRVT